MSKSKPYLYKKIEGMLGSKGQILGLHEIQERLTRFRIEKREVLEIVRELEKQGGVIVLDVKRGMNNNALKVKVCNKGTACFIVLSFSAIVYFVFYALYYGVLKLC